MEQYCIKCGTLIGQDGVGWQSFSFPIGEGVRLRQQWIHLCPSCIEIINDNFEREEFWKKERQYENDKLWQKIALRAIDTDEHLPSKIELPILRKILKDFNILGNEKDGM